MMIHKGGRICYGMLVAQVLPYNETNAVKVSIAYTRENSIRYKESILLMMNLSIRVCRKNM